jgi:hypothetical protein
VICVLCAFCAFCVRSLCCLSLSALLRSTVAFSANMRISGAHSCIRFQRSSTTSSPLLNRCLYCLHTHCLICLHFVYFIATFASDVWSLRSVLSLAADRLYNGMVVCGIIIGELCDVVWYQVWCVVMWTAIS